jgi:hypothetical protein
MVVTLMQDESSLVMVQSIVMALRIPVSECHAQNPDRDHCSNRQCSEQIASDWRLVARRIVHGANAGDDPK